MDADTFLPDAATVAAIEKDIATYNERRQAEHAALERREPIVMMSYAVGLAFLAYLAYRLFSHLDAWYAPPLFVLAVGVGGWTHVQKWARRDAVWTQQNFRDHIVPVMLGFVPNLRYSHGITPRSFAHVPKALLPSHNAKKFDDVISASLDGKRFELFEVVLVQRSKNSETVMFKGVVLACKRPGSFAGLLVATSRTGELRRFFRDLFGTGGLSEIAVRDRELGELYEFRSDNRAEARRLLGGGFAALLVSISKLWPRETPQIAVSHDDVFVLLPSTRDFFELPPIDKPVSYRSHVEPMVRQFASFLAIVREVGLLDRPSADLTEPSAETQTRDAAAPDAVEGADAADAAGETPFVPLLDPVEPPPKQ